MLRASGAVPLSPKRPGNAMQSLYARLYETKNSGLCLLLWLCGMPYMLRDFKNPYDGQPYGALPFVKSVYVTLPIVTLLPGLVELAWLPRQHYSKWWTAFQKCFVAGIWNIFPAGLVIYLVHGDDPLGTGSWTTRSADLADYGWRDVAELLFLLCSHEVMFYATHRMNHTKAIYDTTHGHHHKNKGYVFMVNNSDVDVWELLSQGLFGLILPLFFVKVKTFTHLAALGWFFVYSCTIHSTHMRPTNLHVVHHQHGRLAYNYGLYTPAMDVLFGTYKKPTLENTAVQEDPVQDGAVKQE